ncbi:MAG: hypothetical protein WAO19_06800 [Candidatus Kryptoniota bacterium]
MPTMKASPSDIDLEIALVQSQLLFFITTDNESRWHSFIAPC